jgi:large subunit ribosomal protein L21
MGFSIGRRVLRHAAVALIGGALGWLARAAQNATPTYDERAEAERSRLEAALRAQQELSQRRATEIAALSAQLAEVQSQLHAAEQALAKVSQAAQAAPLPPDDLKAVNGVGPALERALHDLGVHTFAAIAAWTEQDIDRIEAQMKHFKGRIRREGWVESAQKCHLAKYGSAPK